MKRILAAVTIIAMTVSSEALAQKANDMGIGAVGGEPTGLSLKYWLDDFQALDAGIGWSFYANDSLALHTDYLLHSYSILPLSGTRNKLPVYIGAGLRFKAKNTHGGVAQNEDDSIWGIRLPVGVSYLFANQPLDLFAEIVPVFDFAPEGEITLNGGVGLRYYFPVK